MEKIKVIFVCMGNICRSPMAEAVFQQLVKERGLDEKFHIESAGTGPWHIGQRPHTGTQQVLQKHHVSLNARKVGQQVQPDIFEKFDYVIAMDSENKQDLKIYGDATLLLENVQGADVIDVPDPYYDKKFERVYQLVVKGCNTLLNRICEEQNLAC